MTHGGRRSGSGRKTGAPNKATQEAREAIARFVDGNAHRLQDWLDQIADENPERAFNLFQSVIEYHVPKLARTEINGDIQHKVTRVEIVRKSE
jgi:vacuolar-type H+-ATPase subunit E/Vma4